MEVIEVCKKLRSLGIRGANAGGCAIIMLSIYRKLKKEKALKGNECFVYLYEGMEHSYEKNEKFLKGETNKPVSCTHAAFMQNGVLYDITGEISPNEYQITQIIPTSQETTFVVNSINQPRWNFYFERRGEIPKIAEALEIDLSDIEIF